MSRGISTQIQVNFECHIGDLLGMRGVAISAMGVFLLVCVPSPIAFADEPTCRVTIEGIEKTDSVVWAFHVRPDGLPLRSRFRYDGNRVVSNDGSRLTFDSSSEPLSTSQIDLKNWSDLQGATPNRLGIPTRWTMIHASSAFADQFGCM